MSDSEIVHFGDGGVVYSGPDATALYRAVVLAAALRLYARTGMRPNRAYTPTVMLKMAAQITGKKYRRGQHEAAAADVKAWADTMRAALPVTVKTVN